jgi:hypothetical protein
MLASFGSGAQTRTDNESLVVHEHGGRFLVRWIEAHEKTTEATASFGKITSQDRSCRPCRYLGYRVAYLRLNNFAATIPATMKPPIEPNGCRRTKSAVCWTRRENDSPPPLENPVFPVISDAGFWPDAEASLLCAARAGPAPSVLSDILSASSALPETQQSRRPARVRVEVKLARGGASRPPCSAGFFHKLVHRTKASILLLQLADVQCSASTWSIMDDWPVGLVFAAAHWVAEQCGHAGMFILAVIVIVAWAATRPLFHYSDTWQLIINTGTTIITFLMVFVIQNTQNRDTAAV